MYIDDAFYLQRQFHSVIPVANKNHRKLVTEPYPSSYKHKPKHGSTRDKVLAKSVKGVI